MAEPSHIRLSGLSSTCGWLLPHGSAVGPTDQFCPCDTPTWPILCSEGIVIGERRNLWVTRLYKLQQCALLRRAERNIEVRGRGLFQDNIPHLFLRLFNDYDVWRRMKMEVINPPFWPWEWLKASIQLCASAVLTKERSTGIHWKGGWMGPSTSLEAVERRKASYPCRQFTIRLEASFLIN